MESTGRSGQFQSVIVCIALNSEIEILLIIIYLFFLIAMIPFFVGSLIHPYARILGIVILIAALIWLIPLLFCIQGVLYHKLVD